jgi:hypothetical protein
VHSTQYKCTSVGVYTEAMWKGILRMIIDQGSGVRDQGSGMAEDMGSGFRVHCTLCMVHGAHYTVQGIANVLLWGVSSEDY